MWLFMTVLALWDDRAKLLMREAAMEVGGRGMRAGLVVNSPRPLGRQGQSTDVIVQVGGRGTGMGIAIKGVVVYYSPFSGATSTKIDFYFP